ncbi:MAG: hypothetical protein JXA41_00750 [Deltaproteobacteria bacterium]|nr:hypothetical protein [Deltaproteobacteria bacterium]
MSKPIICGMDAGLMTLKIVLLNKAEIIHTAVMPIETNTTAEIAEVALNESLAANGFTQDDLCGIFVTGVGASEIHFASRILPEASCLATGVNRLRPVFDGIILDVGAHKAIAVQCKKGIPYKVAYSDRCASGSGLYLEMVAQLLGMDITEIGALSLKSTETISLQSSCAIYAESEIISLMHNRKRPEDILKGVYKGLAARAFSLMIRAGYIQGKSQVAAIGGTAHNIGMLKALEERIGGEIWVPENPDNLGAIGAALMGTGE